MSSGKKKTGVAPGVTHLTAGPGPTIVCDGKTWRVGFAKQKAKALLENLFREHALRFSRENETPAEYQETKDMARGGHYRTFAPGWNAMLGTPDGTVLYLLSLLQHNHPEATFADAARMFSMAPDEVDNALVEVSPNFFKLAAREWAAEKGQDEKKAEEIGAAMGEQIVKLLKKFQTTQEPVSVSV